MGFFGGVRGRLHYRYRPVEAAAAGLVLLPGTGQHSGHYHEFARQVNSAGLAIWTLDTAGQGLSEETPGRPRSCPTSSPTRRGSSRWRARRSRTSR